MCVHWRYADQLQMIEWMNATRISRVMVFCNFLHQAITCLLTCCWKNDLQRNFHSLEVFWSLTDEINGTTISRSLCFVIPPIKLSLVYSSDARAMYLQRTVHSLELCWSVTDEWTNVRIAHWRIIILLRSLSWERQESLCLAILSTKLSAVHSFATEVSQTASTVHE